MKNDYFKREQDQPRFVFDMLRHLRQAKPNKEDYLQFMAFAMQYAENAKGQLFQDLWALWETDVKYGGFFVEFGAASGVAGSNTYLLERKYGWHGILAEPNPQFIPNIRRHRLCHIREECVYSKTGETLTFLPAEIGELSRLKDIVPEDMQERTGRRSLADIGEIEVETITLNDLLETSGAPRTIDFMSVDTEGSEYEILKNFDFNTWDVRLMCIEHNHAPVREDLLGLMQKHGFRRKWTNLTLFDDWYVRER
jgi:FkbM family methyltransferase